MTSERSIRVDRSKGLVDEPWTGHNRWHPNISPALRVEPGVDVVLEARDGLDGQITRDWTAADIPKLDLGLLHALTGPVYVEGAEPGDLLEVHVLDVTPDDYGFTIQVPGFGFLRDDFPEPFIAHWDIDGVYAVSEQLPNVRVPGAPFMGVMGVAPSHELLARANRRESAVVSRGGPAVLPEPSGAVPTTDDVQREGLRTTPPRENGGNLDVKQLTRGCKVLMPTFVDGALFSVGDGHFAQGDGEVCGTAVEIAATCTVNFQLRKGEARERGIRDVSFVCDDYFMPPEMAVPRRCHVTTGMPLDQQGENQAEDITLAARNAIRNMIGHLKAEYGYTAQQAYAICSVAVDLRISQAVDVPNMTVAAYLPTDIFQG